MSVQNSRTTGYFLTGRRSNFLYVEGSYAWLYDCVQFVPALCCTDRGFDRKTLCYQDTVRYTEPITRKIFKDVTPMSSDNNTQNGSYSSRSR